jgi:predicted alpha/beta-hydrolase family hydrolase
MVPEKFFSRLARKILLMRVDEDVTRPFIARDATFTTRAARPSKACDDRHMRVVLGHGASGNAASMKPYVDGFKRRGIDAVAVDLPRGGAERAVPIFIKTSGRGLEVIGGGQSFGGRVASMAAVEAGFGGLVLFSYPLHRPGYPDQLRIEHLPSILCPTLFLSGDRDPFARVELLKQYTKLVPNSRLEIFKGQGHGLLKVLDQALDVAAEFILTNCK